MNRGKIQKILFSIAIIFNAISIYILATAWLNINSLNASKDRVKEFKRVQRAASYEFISAVSANKSDQFDDPRPYIAPNWPEVVLHTMPSAVAIAAIPNLEGSDNRAWIVPGVKQNLATSLLTKVYAWRHDWEKLNSTRDYQIICSGAVMQGNEVLTAAHCLNNAEALKIRTASGEWRVAHSIGKDISSDIAVLGFDGPPLPSIKISKYFPRQGQDIMVIGSPSGHSFSVGAGIVARYGKDSEVFSLNDFVLITASTYYGSSGGFVVNPRGEVISLISYGSMTYTQTIPINRAIAVADAIRQRYIKSKNL